ncbi:hypothetical protein EHS25_003898 [Saitozyma podzolica]|uniref:HpcH/HpaI aldolase/citrate lyase domain-containing protein n=1 Tax=Saitozyma podzolica TaxID=1890683 RepID=A0A427Y3V3_9TREE|nr:hypothetical protein EHS25_003898 [Saitozyma podzolica]
MDKATYLRNALAKKEKGIGFWLTFPHPSIAKTILAGGGFNWVLMDAEHGLITDSDYYTLANHIAASGASPIIRIPVDSEWQIKRALDAGAHGVMTPMCHSAEDAARIVSWSKYPPLGSRGYGPMFCPHTFNVAEATYPTQADKSLLVIVQIESRKAIENVEAIAAVPGLDVLFIGPFDLSKQMNVQFGSDEHEAAIQKTLKAAKSAGKTAAIFCSNGAQAKERLAQGFDMVSITTDVGSVAAEFDRQLAATLSVEVGQARSAY